MADPATGAGDVQVSDERITILVNALEQEIGLLDQERNKLVDATDSTVAGWSGGAAQQFRTGQGDANFNLDRLISTLGNLRDLVTMSKNDFTAEEQEQISQMRIAQSGLGEMGNSNLDSLG